MRVLVTGSSGYLGRSFCAAAERRHKPLGVDIVGGVEESGVVAVGAQADITRPETVRQEWAHYRGGEDPEAIVNFAALVGEEECRRQPVRAEEVNGLGPLGLARAFPEAFFIQVSTASVLGPKDREQHPYAYSKAMAEKVLRAYVPPEKLVIVRLGTVFGAGAGPVRWEILLNKMVRAALETGGVVVPDKNMRRPLVSVKRVVREILCVVQDPGLYSWVVRAGPVPVCAFNTTLHELPLLVASGLGVEVLVKKWVAEGDLRDYTLPVTCSEWSEEEAREEIRGLRAAWKRETA